MSKKCPIEWAQIVQSQTKTSCSLRRHSQQMQVTHYIPQGIRIGSELSAGWQNIGL